MRWKDVLKGFKFKDGSEVTQRHQIHLYDCYEIDYDGKKIVLSKDHLIQVNLTKLPKEAQEEIRKWCNGQIPLKEDIKLEILSPVSNEEKDIISKYISGEIQSNEFTVEDLSTDTQECYLFYFPNRTFSIEVFVTRIPIEFDNQKIDENNYWIPVEGLAYLYNKYGELDIN